GIGRKKRSPDSSEGIAERSKSRSRHLLAGTEQLPANIIATEKNAATDVVDSNDSSREVVKEVNASAEAAVVAFGPSTETMVFEDEPLSNSIPRMPLIDLSSGYWRKIQVTDGRKKRVQRNQPIQSPTFDRLDPIHVSNPAHTHKHMSNKEERIFSVVKCAATEKQQQKSSSSNRKAADQSDRAGRSRADSSNPLAAAASESGISEPPTRLEEKSRGSFDPHLAGELPEPIPGAISAILEPIVWVELNSATSVNFCKCSDDDLYYRCLPVCRDFSVRDE
ncbi:hypothetical protein M569_12649, partial [Genlisea aurea]